MRTTSMAVWIWILCGSMALLWLPSRAWADPTTGKCAKIGDDMWGKKELPNNQASIDMLMKLAVDCPSIAGSMKRLADGIKAWLQRQAEAQDDVKTAGMAYQSTAYNPGGMMLGNSWW